MPTLRIHDLDDGMLAVELRRLIELLAPRSLRGAWRILQMTPGLPPGKFEANGRGGEQLEALAVIGVRIRGHTLAALAKETNQVIWGEFAGSLYGTKGAPWVTIRFIDSTFCEVETYDEAVLDTIKSSFRDVRQGDAPND